MEYLLCTYKKCEKPDLQRPDFQASKHLPPFTGFLSLLLVISP